jgi:L-threonylcarbamoyladenylate synthase
VRVIAEYPAALEEALKVLREGGCVVHATETCYGLACDLSSAAAVGHLFAVKGRPLDQPVSALFPSVDEAKHYVEWNDRAEALAREFLPGPLTIILPLRKDAPRVLHTCPCPKAGTLGIRISSHAWAEELVRRFGSPIATTSANVHGEPSPYAIDAISEQYARMGVKPDLIVDGGPLVFRKPSRIIDCSGTSDVQRRP